MSYPGGHILVLHWMVCMAGRAAGTQLSLVTMRFLSRSTHTTLVCCTPTKKTVFPFSKQKRSISHISHLSNISKTIQKHHGFKNKRPMGHIAHLTKQFKSINTYDYIITLIKRVS